MKRFLQAGIEALTKIDGGQSLSRSDRQVRLEVEDLEDRTALSPTPLLVSPGMSAGLVEHLAHRLHLFIPSPSQSLLDPSALVKLAHGLHLKLAAPDLAGVSFHLWDPSIPQPHSWELDISTQTYNPDGTVDFTGRWGDSTGQSEPLPPGDPQAHPLTFGQMRQTPWGILTSFGWGGGSRVFLGSITQGPGGGWHITGEIFTPEWNSGVVGHEIH
jgi:hypothetical protein